MGEEAKVEIMIGTLEPGLGELYDKYATQRLTFPSMVPQNPVKVKFGIRNESHIALPFQ